MNIAKPTAEIIEKVNQSRESISQTMSESDSFLLITGPCSVDGLHMPTGELAVERHMAHNQVLVAIEILKNIKIVSRFVGEKSRTSTGQNGLLHTPNGPQLYNRAAQRSVLAGHILASELASETNVVLASPYLSLAWIGARNADDNGPRISVRPTAEAYEAGIHPLPTFVKNGVDGSADSMLNAINTIVSERPHTRTRLTSDGIETVTTLANPHVGVILRGHKSQKPTSDLEGFIENEVGEARELLDNEFGKDAVPLVYDVSHKHAELQGGGEKGQLANIEAISELLGSKCVKLLGIMAETYIHPGKQPPNGQIPGLSLTDACIGQARTDDMFRTLDNQIGLTRLSKEQVTSLAYA